MNITFSDKYPLIEPTGKEDNGRPTFRVMQDVFVTIVDKDCNYSARIPFGFVTDFGSIPRIFWNIFNPLDPKCQPDYLLHDLLYQMEFFTRSKCDMILYESLKANKNSAFKASIIWTAVRLGGWKPWNDHKKSSVLELRRMAGIYGEDRPLFD